jgi:hypothetical protein
VGPSHEKLNNENSILEIAKMQNSGNGSNSDNLNNQSVMDRELYQNNHNISRDYSPIPTS